MTEAAKPKSRKPERLLLTVAKGALVPGDGKTCTCCGHEKTLSDFHKDKGKHDGLSVHCKSCACSRTVKWGKDNTSRKRRTTQEWEKKNPHKVSAIKSRWKKANRDAVRTHDQNRRARELFNGGRLSNGLRAKLLESQRGKCACCRTKIDDDSSHLDHVIPLALGGPNEDWNMQLLCGPCNLSKGAKHPVDFMQQRGYLL